VRLQFAINNSRLQEVRSNHLKTRVENEAPHIISIVKSVCSVQCTKGKNQRFGGRVAPRTGTKRESFYCIIVCCDKGIDKHTFFKEALPVSVRLHIIYIMPLESKHTHTQFTFQRVRLPLTRLSPVSISKWL